MSTFIIKGDICKIGLTNHDEPAIIDASDTELARQCKSWCALFNKDGSVTAVMGYVPGVGKVCLHRLLMVDELVASDLQRPEMDHINRDPLCNVRSNLRVVDRGTNNRSRKPRGKSRFPGVSWHKGKGKWRATMQIDGKHVHLGYFSDELDAAREYRTAFRKLDDKADYDVWKELDARAPGQLTIMNFYGPAVVNQK